MKRSPINPRNRSRMSKLFIRQFHSVERVKWIGSQPCATCGIEPTDEKRSHNSHMVGKIRGTWRDIIPQCWQCHGVHHQPPEWYLEKWPIERLRELAAKYAEEWTEKEKR